MELWSIGHSTRSVEELVAALKAHGIELVTDVRAFPGSRLHPHLSRESLQTALPAAGIEYRWLGDRLGGFKRKHEGSRHVALRNEGFRSYADHMETAAFKSGVEELLSLSRGRRVAYMCAERLWWRCHRCLLSDYLALARGVAVTHILDAEHSEPHRAILPARVVDGGLAYDRPAERGHE